MDAWSELQDGTAVGPTVPVVVEGQLVATLCVLWDDELGVQVQVADDERLDALSGVQALALADALREAARMMPPM